MTTPDWQPTACILCECNCGLEVQLVEWLRAEERFETTQELVRAMDRDVERTRDVLAGNAAS